jgi:hypothetical protein
MPNRTRNRTAAVAITLWAAVYSSSSPGAESTAQPCADIVTGASAAGVRKALTGSDFARHIEGMSADEREAAILEQALDGNVPSFLRRAEPVTLTGHSSAGTPVRVTLCVAPDYLAIGSDTDYLFVPMRLNTAIAVATRYRALLPTRKMVDAIYAQAQVHLQPQPLPASDAMRSTGYYWHHSELIREQRLSFTQPLGALTAGDKKDLVLTNRSWVNLDRVAIYGWHLPGGKPIQPLSTVHGWHYADYSHGVRLVSAVAYVDDKATALLQLLQDPQLAAVLSDEGALRNAGELLRILASQALNSVRCLAQVRGCRPTHQIEEVPVIRKSQEPGSELISPFPVDFAHPLDQVLHQ